MGSSRDFDSLLQQIKNEYSRICAENAVLQKYFHRAEVPTTTNTGILSELFKERPMTDIPDESNDNRLPTTMKSHVWARPLPMPLPMPKWTKPLPAMSSHRSSASSKESAPSSAAVTSQGLSDLVSASKGVQFATATGRCEHRPLSTGLSLCFATSGLFEGSRSRPDTAQVNSNTKFEDMWVSIVSPTNNKKSLSVNKTFRMNLLTMRGPELIEKYLEPVMCLIILINMILTGVSADTEGWSGWIWVDAFFTCIFILEITVKVRICGLAHTFRGPQSKWNLFDCGIVVLCIVDFVYSIFHGPSAGPQSSDSLSFSLFRMFRLGRMVRMFRVLRIPICKELWMMINGMVGGVRTLIWACVILTIPVYMLGFLLSQTLGVHNGMALFDSVPQAMFTVIRCMTSECTGSNGQPLILDMVATYGWLLGLLYVLFILITMLGLFNLITAIFVENAVAAAKNNESLQAKRRQRSKDQLTAKIRQLIKIFWAAQRGRSNFGSGTNTFNMQECSDMQVSLELYEEVIANTSAQHILEDLEIAEDDYFDLFDILDTDGNGSLDVKEIVEGMLRLRGNARRSDVVGVGYAVRALQISFVEFAEIIQSKIDELSRAWAGPPHVDEKCIPHRTCLSTEK